MADQSLVLTNVCVESTARDGFMMDYNVTIVKDCCTGSSPEVHDAALANLQLAFSQVLNTSDLLHHWSPIESKVV